MAKKDRTQVKTDSEKLAAEILLYITHHPGVHFNDLLRALNLAPGTLQYHLNRMEKENQVLVQRLEYKTLYFPPALHDPMDQRIMILLRQEIPRKLMIILMEESNKTGQELTKLLKITKSTLSYYTRRLENVGVLKIVIEGREKHYSVTDPNRVANLLTEHKKSFSDKMVDRFVELWVRI